MLSVFPECEMYRNFKLYYLVFTNYNSVLELVLANFD